MGRFRGKVAPASQAQFISLSERQPFIDR